MDCTGLTDEEFERTCEVCRGVRVRGTDPAYLRGLLCHVLARTGPEGAALSGKLAALRDWQMEVVFHLLMDRQEAGADARR
jgi:hypothetical protein